LVKLQQNIQKEAYNHKQKIENEDFLTLLEKSGLSLKFYIVIESLGLVLQLICREKAKHKVF
jgi:hypothetical protein